MSPVRVCLTLVPFIWTVALLPFFNHVHPMVFGLPLLAAWLIGGIFVAFICLFILYHIDRDRYREED